MKIVNKYLELLNECLKRKIRKVLYLKIKITKMTYIYNFIKLFKEVTLYYR